MLENKWRGMEKINLQLIRKIVKKEKKIDYH